MSEVEGVVEAVVVLDVADAGEGAAGRVPSSRVRAMTGRPSGWRVGARDGGMTGSCS
ncbi:hypothetical protein ACFYRJ_36565 [Streptomyces sp. NPDC005531]|uniref:hypothetical protein n=1 Tax=Streptomyces sp. NPDC005531 TaxID=3364722 RepID=UPI0036BA5236